MTKPILEINNLLRQFDPTLLWTMPAFNQTEAKFKV